MHFQPFHPFARTQFRKRICFQQNQFDILMYYGSFAKASGNIYAFLLFITDKDNIFLKSRRVLVVEGLIASLFDLTVSKNLIEYVHARNCLSKEWNTLWDFSDDTLYRFRDKDHYILPEVTFSRTVK